MACHAESAASRRRDVSGAIDEMLERSRTTRGHGDPADEAGDPRLGQRRVSPSGPRCTRRHRRVPTARTGVRRGSQGRHGVGGSRADRGGTRSPTFTVGSGQPELNRTTRWTGPLRARNPTTERRCSPIASDVRSQLVAHRSTAGVTANRHPKADLRAQLGRHSQIQREGGGLLQGPPMCCQCSPSAERSTAHLGGNEVSQ